jgi:phosphatidylglycerol:prolipoprotein diacylglycerol transferase
MIPYVTFSDIHVGPIPIHTFGVLVASGLWVGTWVAARDAEHVLGAHARALLSKASGWALLGGLVGGHLLHVLGYHPELLRQEGPLVLVKVWDGLSSMGGLIGGTLGLGVYLRHRGERFMLYLNSLALGTAPGWAVARLGCVAVHDHPGRLTDFFLAVRFPAGARHDLGLDDLLVLAALSAILHLVARRWRPEGKLAGVLALGYAVPRFFLDFLRATDLPFSDGRILGFTPAQYVCAVLVPVGIWLLLRRPSRPAVRGFESLPVGGSSAPTS